MSCMHIYVRASFREFKECCGVHDKLYAKDETPTCWKDYKKFHSFLSSSREDDVFVHYEWVLLGSVCDGVAATIQFSYAWETL